MDDYTCYGAGTLDIQDDRRDGYGTDCAKGSAGRYLPKIRKGMKSGPGHLGQDTTFPLLPTLPSVQLFGSPDEA